MAKNDPTVGEALIVRYELIEGLIGGGHYENPLIREVVVEVGDDLDGHISFSSSRWSHHHC